MNDETKKELGTGGVFLANLIALALMAAAFVGVYFAAGWLMSVVGLGWAAAILLVVFAGASTLLDGRRIKPVASEKTEDVDVKA